MLNRGDAEQALVLLTAYANSGVSNEVSLACAQVCRSLREELAADDIGKDMTLIDAQRAENVRLTVAAEAPASLCARFAVLRREYTQQSATLAGLTVFGEVEDVLYQAAEAHDLAVEGSRNDTTGKDMRAAKEKALGICLSWGGVR